MDRQQSFDDKEREREGSEIPYSFYANGVWESPTMVWSAITRILSSSRSISELVRPLAMALLTWIAVEIVRRPDGLSGLGFLVVLIIVLVVSGFGLTTSVVRNHHAANPEVPPIPSLES